MAKLYSIEVFFKVHNVNNLLYDFANLLISKSAAKLYPIKTWKPEEVFTYEGIKIQKGIKGVRENIDGENSYCFSFKFPKEPAFDEFAKPLDFIRETGIGCIWTSLLVGNKWGRLRLQAATSSISLLLDNDLLQQHITNGLKGTSEAIILNKDAEGGKFIYPHVAPCIALQREDEYFLEEFEYHLEIDAYANNIIHELLILKENKSA